jgi:hypothetical protein
VIDDARYQKLAYFKNDDTGGGHLSGRGNVPSAERCSHLSAALRATD